MRVGRQVLGGASGVLIVEGIERANPEVAGSPSAPIVALAQGLKESYDCV